MSVYRDELEAAHARIQALEAELREVKGVAIEKVPADGQALVRANAGAPATPRWLGAPLQLRLERELQGEVPTDAHTEMIEKMRRAFGVAGSTTVLPGSLAWNITGAPNTLTPTVNIYVTTRKGRTRITLEQRLGTTVGAVYGGVGGGVGGGGMILPGALLVLNPILGSIAMAAWLGGTYALCRRLFRSRAKVHANRLDRLLDELVVIARDAIARAKAEAT